MGSEVFLPPEAAELQEQLHQAPLPLPGVAGPAPTRWSLAYMRKSLPQLRDYRLGGIWQVLRRWGITYRRGRQAVHSPDPE